MYGLTSQVRRAAVSIPSNIAERKGRSSDRELCHFLCNARGALFELQTQMRIAEKLGYASADESDSFQRNSERICQMINGLIRAVRPVA